MSNDQREQEKKGFSNFEIQDIEADRKEPEKWNIIHLLRDGNYWHANEWSAWLMSSIIYMEMKHRYPNEERVPIKPIKKFAKNIEEELVFVGCQEKSFDKYLPKELQISWEPINNIRIDVGIKLPAEIGKINNYEHLQKMYLDWKASLPLAKEKGNSVKQQQSNVSSQNICDSSGESGSGILAIFGRILSFPLNQSSPAQAYEFVGKLQKDLLKHL